MNSNPIFCKAEIHETRLVSESVSVHETDLAALGPGQAVEAKTNVDTTVGLNNAKGTADTIIIESKVTVEVVSKVSAKDTETVLLNYSNVFKSFFKISAMLGAPDSSPPPVAVFEPYIAQGNWLAVKRADDTIRAATIANIRLVVPAVGQFGESLDSSSEGPKIRPVSSRKTAPVKKAAPKYPRK